MNPVPAGKRREQQKAQTREMILESTRTLLEDKGYDKTTIRAVAAHAEIGLGTIYKHFSNKRSLFAAAFSGDLEKLFKKALATIPANRPFKYQFIHIARQFYTYYTSRPALTKVYLTNLFLMAKDELALINAFDETFAEKINTLVEQAQKRGEISPKRTSGFVTMSIMADYFFVLVNFFLRYEVMDPEELIGILEGMMDQIL
jgi:TetR/AcrR family transcriptional repressor of mexJK operon